MGGILSWILSFFLGKFITTMLAVALIATGAWGIMNYTSLRNAQETISQYKSQVTALEEERDRQDKRLKHLGEISQDREQRKQEWVAEALKWKNRMNKLIEDNPDVAEWAHNLYRAPD